MALPIAVLDTHVVVSTALLPTSTSGRALLKALGQCELVMSNATWNELQEVLHRSKFDRYFAPAGRRTEFLHVLARSTRWCEPSTRINDCVDPKDNKFLELACDASATLIVSGDDDQLRMNPWRKVAILTPAAFLVM